MLKKIFKELVQQKYRYITPDGAVYDKPLEEKFHRRAEFKAVAAILAGTLLCRSFNDAATLIDAVQLGLGTGLGYVVARRMSGPREASFMRHVYNRDAVVDTKPKPFDRTSPEDLLSTYVWHQVQKSSTFKTRTVMMGGLTGFAFMNAVNSEAYVAVDPHFFISGMFIGLLGERASNAIANMDRSLKILNGEYVVLAETPEKQKEKTPQRAGAGVSRPVLEGS